MRMKKYWPLFIPLGLLAFGMTTVLLNLHNAGFFELNSMILAMGLCYGGLAQVVAGIMEWKKGNTFATTAFISYGFFWLSLVALFLIGAFDNISVVVRHTLVQILTPDQMRGRVSAVNQIFIGSSNELGGLESGVTAAWWGAVPATLVGGIGTCIVTALWAFLFPELRSVDSLEKPVEIR